MDEQASEREDEVEIEGKLGVEEKRTCEEGEVGAHG